ncbi:LuxR C-terminal-related transcriptional regulator [Microbacterium sp. BLY]|uniref:LuxR C-terminal-related transcriptional regulator n=1 Tax=Microbacterium sp. BLY TaxID=2823280 RepID=UPI001B323AE1|nr:LuxR C-terminal-related transcriptional regulator [Microbacterium sp. BLY]MBP3978053.1 AAA family ATPase [Microbacterium sp. BLY]
MLEGAYDAGGGDGSEPASVNGDIRRERLLSKLAAAMDGAWTLTLVSAPAGSGKTRLLAHWAADLRSAPGIDVVWVSLERGEAGLPVLREALRKTADPALRRAIDSATPENSVVGARALARAVREARKRIVIIIDDVHRAEDGESARMISAFVDTVPGNAHVVLAGRGVRAIPLARRRLAGVALEIDGHALAFTPAEVREFFRVRGIRLSQGEISTVLTRTEGWAAGLQLMMLDAAGEQIVLARPLRGDAPEVADYFVEEIFGELDPSLRTFLESTAVVDAFTPDLATALSGGSSAAAVIDRLRRLHVLVGPDTAEPPQYHYPPLLREFLAGRLREGDPRRAEALHRCAADWFAAQGRPLLALRHATLGGEGSCSAGVLRRCGMQLVLDGRSKDVLRVLSELPAAFHVLPTVRMLVAAAELAGGDPSGAVVVPLPGIGESVADRRWRLGIELHTTLRRGGIAETLAGAVADLRNLSGEDQLDAYALLQAATAELFVGRLDRAETTARLAGDLSRAIGARSAELQAEAVIATCGLFHGRLREAVDAATALERRWRELGEPANPFFEVTRVWRFWVPYESMRPVEEGETLRRAAEVITDGGETAIARGLQGMRALLGLDRLGDPREAAIMLLDSLTPRDDLPLPPHWYAMMGAFAVRAFDRLDEPTLRDRFLADVEEALGDTGEVLVLRAIAAVHDHRDGIARGALAPVLDGRVPCLLPASMVDAWLVEAELDVRDGEPDRAQFALATALALAEPEDHVRRVAEAGPVVSRLLSARATAGARTHFAGRVRDRLAAAGVLVEEDLTDRERVVLSALSRNATLRQIAQQEYISPNTVKTHVRNIYRKLGVSDRDAMTAAARALGLL